MPSRSRLSFVVALIAVFAVVGSAQTTAAKPKTECISGVCLGADLKQISTLNIPWLQKQQPLTKLRVAGRGNLQETQRTLQEAQHLREVQNEFRGLTDQEYKVLVASLYVAGGHNVDDIPSMEPPYIRHFIIQAANTPVFEKAVACNGVPLHGVFKSESGHLTGVLLMSDNGKYRVVRLIRQWALNAPANANSAQQNQVMLQQLQELYKQVQENYVGEWNMNRYHVPPDSASANSKNAFAYFDWSDGSHPTLVMYTTAFKNLPGVLKNPHYIEWKEAGTVYDQMLAHCPACAVKSPTVKIN
jgi:hypothetical protein